MMSRHLSQFDMPWLTCIGLVIFMAVFVGALVWIFRRGSKEMYQTMSAMPLEAAQGGENRE